MTMTMIEKILARVSGQDRVSPGHYVTAKIDAAMMPENFRLMGQLIAKAGIDEAEYKIWNPDRFYAIIDHRVPAYSTAAAETQLESRKLAKRLKVKHFYDVFPGVCHQVMVDQGHVRPGMLIVGADSHSTSYGALNCAGTGIGASDMVYAVHTGELWFRVPPTIKVNISGKLPDGVGAKDIILYIAGRYGTDLAQYKSIEWTGSAVQAMSLDSRLTISNMSVELGAKCGLFEADDKVTEFLKDRTSEPYEPVVADPDARYEQVIDLDASQLVPQVALPHNVGNVRPAAEVVGCEIDQAVIASCCHGRIEDMEIAANMLRGRRVHPGVRFFIAPASWVVYREALERGLIAELVDAGVMIGNPSCGFCTGFQGALAAGERCIAAAPRNFRGRMGSNDAEIYLGTPATVTASALSGRIVDPREV